jgi:RsiW-degrading membrane proteinase PrsW (M82 family)
VLIAGIVQEAAKIAPVFFFRQRRKNDFTPQLGLIAGAVAGAGFGIFEAVWKLNLILPDIGFASSLSNSTLRVLTADGFNYLKYILLGFSPLMGTFGSFYSIVFHIAASALVGYGLAKHRGWQFYLLAVLLNALINFGAFLAYYPRISMTEGIIWVFVPLILVTVFALWLRWHKPRVKPAVSGPADVTPLVIPPKPIS